MTGPTLPTHGRAPPIGRNRGIAEPWRMAGSWGLTGWLAVLAVVVLVPARLSAHDGPQTAFATVAIERAPGPAPDIAAGARATASGTAPVAAAQSAPDATSTGVRGRVRYALTLATLVPASTVPAGAAAPGATRPDPMALATIVATRVRITSAGTDCRPVEMHVRPPAPPRTATTVELAYECPRLGATLHLRDDLFDLAGRDQHTLVRFDGEDGPRQVMLDSTTREATFVTGRSEPSTAAAPALSARHGIAAFLGLGVEHILIGWDHLLFLLALILPGAGVGELVRTVTAFTIAHSITLGLSATGHVTVPVAPVEALIALSIAWVAAQNLTTNRATSRRWMLAFVFGLVHGFGFSSVLREIGLPTDARLLALLNFNVGVEVGQLVAVLAMLPLLRWLRSRSSGVALMQGLSGIVLVCGAVLFIARLGWADGG